MAPVDDGASASGADAPARRQRSGLGCRTLAIAALCVLAAVVGLGVWSYYRFIHYERVAARHLPPGTLAAARIDIEKIVLFEPVRKHLVPIVDGDASRLKRLEAATGVVVARELREIVIARGERWNDWVLVVGGRFSDDMVDGIVQVLREDGIAVTLEDDGTATIGGSAAFGQATDGTLVFAASRALLAGALPASETYRALGLPLEDAGGLAIDGSIVRPYGRNPLALVSRGVRELGNVERITGRLVLGTPLQVVCEIDLQEGARPEALEESTQAMLGAARTVLAAAVPGDAGLPDAKALAEARVEAVGEDRVRVTFQWSQDALDRAADRIGEGTEALLGVD